MILYGDKVKLTGIELKDQMMLNDLMNDPSAEEGIESAFGRYLSISKKNGLWKIIKIQIAAVWRSETELMTISSDWCLFINVITKIENVEMV